MICLSIVYQFSFIVINIYVSIFLESFFLFYFFHRFYGLLQGLDSCCVGNKVAGSKVSCKDSFTKSYRLRNETKAVKECKQWIFPDWFSYHCESPNLFHNWMAVVSWLFLFVNHWVYITSSSDNWWRLFL